MNGAAVALQLVPETAPAPQISIELEIGTATARAVGVIGRGVAEFLQAGKISLESKSLGGEIVARLYELQQAAPSGFDFAGTVRIEGMKTLRAWHAASSDHAMKFPETPVAEYIDELLEILSNVERAMAN